MNTQIKCDVLIIGGGGAALRASIAAKSLNADVLIVSKGEIGKSGATYYSVAEVGAFNVPDGAADPTDNPEVFYEDMKKAAQSMARLPLCEVLANNAVEAMHDLEKIKNGDKIFARENGGYKVYKACFSSKARSHVVQNHFKPILNVLREEVKRLNIRQMSNITVTDLLVEDGRCFGAYALGNDGEPVVILAKSVIMATGGASRLFKKNMYPVDISGDGYAMAYRAGAQITNMEFIQSGVGLAFPAINLFQNYLWGGMPRLTNIHGEEFIGKYLPEGLTPSEVLQKKKEHFPFSSSDNSRFIEISIQSEINKANATKNGNVYLDFKHLDFEKILAEKTNFSSMWPLTYKWYKDLGLDLEKEAIEIACFAHAINGGLLINENAETSIKGLYAAGETAAGPHGADRLGGNMSVTCQVFGKIAGENAARLSQRTDEWNSCDKSKKQAESFISKFKSDGRAVVSDLLMRLQESSDKALLILRNEEGLSKYMDELNEIENLLHTGTRIASQADIKEAVCLQNLIETGRMIARAARMRTESRGSHYRTDYPSIDEQLGKNIIIEKDKIYYE
ncbi:MAG: FAD-binding protein [Acetivibrionales bacterium]|jgi:fumarate reductase (CoM/CoB) subunit A